MDHTPADVAASVTQATPAQAAGTSRPSVWASGSCSATAATVPDGARASGTVPGAARPGTGRAMAPPTDDEALAHHYLVGDLEAALAEDDRIHEMGVHVLLAGDRVVVTGTVASEHRRAEVLAVAREHVARHAPHHRVVDDVEVVGLAPTGEDPA